MSNREVASIDVTPLKLSKTNGVCDSVIDYGDEILKASSSVSIL